MDLVHLLIWVLVLGLIGYLVFYILGLMPVPQPFKNVAIIIVCIIFILILLNMLGVLGMPIRVGELMPMVTSYRV